MIHITDKGIEGAEMAGLGYVKRRPVIGRLVLPLTRYLRAVNARRYVVGGERLLDIGCGDGYFLKHVQCKERYGLDKILGDRVTDSLAFPGSWFDYVTMLAVIEHLSEPRRVLKEIHRVLKPEGKLVITTPRKAAEILIRLYARDIDREHESYFDYTGMRNMARGLFEITGYHTFDLGFNQAYCLQKV